MPRAKKAVTKTVTPEKSWRQINVSMTRRTHDALALLAAKDRRPVAQMARLLLEDATGTAPAA